MSAPRSETIAPSGLALAIGAYLLWGFLPILVVTLHPSGPIEIVAWRIVLSLVFCVLLLAVTRGWSRLIAVVRDRATVGSLALASVLILVNWLVYVYASLNGQIVEASLGYFANPIVTVLLGVLVLRERLRVTQWVAIAISAIAVLVLALGYGSFPWISLALAFSFGLYGLVKKRVAAKTDAISGLTVETGVLTPAAVVTLAVIAAGPGITLGAYGATHAVLMLSLGVVTAVPLLMFAASARRIPLVYLGIVQFVAPIMQFLIGVVVLHEEMPPQRWAGFAIVWLSLIILTVDMLRHSGRRAAPAPAPVAAGAPQPTAPRTPIA